MSAFASAYPLITASALLESFRDQKRELCPRERFYITTWLDDGSKWNVYRDEAAKLPILDARYATLWDSKFEAIKYLFQLKYLDHKTGHRFFHRSRVQRVAHPQYN